MAYTGEAKREYQRKWLAGRRQKALDELGGICVQCGSDDRLEFDHKERSAKECNIAWIWSRKWDFIWKELAKCQLLCYSCHKSKTKEENIKLVHGTRNMYMKHGCRCESCKAAASKHRERYRKK